MCEYSRRICQNSFLLNDLGKSFKNKLISIVRENNMSPVLETHFAYDYIYS